MLEFGLMFSLGMIVNVHDCICEDVDCNGVIDVDRIEIVDID